MVGGDADADLLAGQMVGVTGEDGFQLGAGGQLQAVQGRGAEEGLADDLRLQLAVRGVDDIVRTQQYVHRTARCPGVGAVAVDDAQFGLHRIRALQQPTNEVALANEAGDEGRQWLVVQVERGIPLLQPAFMEDPDMVADGEGFFLIMGDQNGAGATGLEDVAHLMTEAAAQFAIEVGEGLIEQQQLRFGCQGAGQ